MKSLTKRIASAGAAAVLAASLFTGLHLLSGGSAFADADGANAAYEYNYENLTIKDSSGATKEYSLAKKFYQAFADMNEDGDFKDGAVQYSLTEHDLATSDEIKAWVENGNLTIPKAFSAARDAYLSDHPEIFYIDFYKMTISAGRTNGVYSAYIDSGREANLYHDGGFTSLSEVNSAIDAFNSKVDTIVNGANAAADADVYGTAKEVVKARYVNQTLAESIKYDYGALDDYLTTGSSASSGAFTESAYGGLVLNKSVCTGYSRAYKVVMDKLGIPCLVIKGYSQSKDEKGNNVDSSVPHAWNYVQLKNPVQSGASAVRYSLTASADESAAKWYAVDVTWNSSSSDRNRYTLMSSTAAFRDRVTDNIISSSGYELTYPELSPTAYGSTDSANSLSVRIDYVPEGDAKDDYNNPLVISWQYVSYNGKSALRLLEEDGLRIAFRTCYQDDDAVSQWTGWTDVVNYKEYVEHSTMMEDYFIVDDGKETKLYANTSVVYVQFAVIADAEPTLGDALHPDLKQFYEADHVYSDGKKLGDHFTAVSDAVTNLSFGTYTPAPYIIKTNPLSAADYTINEGMRDPSDPNGRMADGRVPTFEITYDEELHILDEEKPIGITYASDHANTEMHTKFVPFEDGSLVQLVYGEDSNGNKVKNTLRFKFGPSLRYEHNREMYIFTFSNVGSAKTVTKNDGTVTTSDKLPNTVPYVFSRAYMACPNIFGDGRLWVDCCAQPTLLDNSDLSEVNFQDPDGGTYFSAAERSQMLLVVEDVNTETENTMLDEIGNSSALNVNKEDIIDKATYNIDLQICGKYPKIPDGSYVKIALGFPEGYGPEDEGVTFKIYHRKHIQGNEYIVEEVPCVVTQYGIVASVTSFSPYMVAVVPADKVTDKTVYASVDGKGGSLNNADGQVKTVKDGETCEYTIKPDTGYAVYSVTLNGEEVTARVVDDKLKLTYEELATNNEIVIKYISETAKTRYATMTGFEVLQPKTVYVPAGTLYGGTGDTVYAGDVDAVAIVIAAGAGIVALAAIAITIAVVAKRKTN